MASGPLVSNFDLDYIVAMTMKAAGFLAEGVSSRSGVHLPVVTRIRCTDVFADETSFDWMKYRLCLMLVLAGIATLTLSGFGTFFYPRLW
jgi:hypothetical protein